MLETRHLLCAAFLALLPSAARPIEAVVLEQKATTTVGGDGRGRSTVRRQHLEVARGMARLEGENGEVTIVRLDKGRLYEVDLLLRSYFERDITDFRARWRRVNAILLKEIAQMPRNHPMRYERIDALTDGLDKWDLIWGLDPGPEKDKLLAKYHLPPSKPVYSVRRTDKVKDICGRSCRLYKVFEDDTLRAFAWVAGDIRLDRDLVEFLKVSGVLPEEVARELSKVKGFPLEYAVFWRDGRVERVETVSVEKKDLPVSRFEVPRGFVKQERR